MLNLLGGSKYFLMFDYCFYCIFVELICVRKLLFLLGFYKYMLCCSKFCFIINCDKNICKNGNILIIFIFDNYFNFIWV